MVGTKRILGVSEEKYPPDGYDELPAGLPSKMDWAHSYFGDYTVCPFEPSRQGVMRPICIESVDRVVVRAH